jgi:4-hydroxy-tetrahydrodipicolinate synthase
LKLVAEGSDAIVAHGTTGESPTLTHEEEYELYRVLSKVLRGKAKLIAGTGSNSTATAIASTRKAETIGVDGALLVVPYYNKPSQDGMIAHFKAVAENTGLPLMIYNIPGRTGVNMLPETLAQLVQVRNYVAIKESAGSVEQVAAMRQQTPESFAIYSGDDSLTLPFLSVGACGVVSVASHIVGREIGQMIEDFLGGRVQSAEKLHLRLLPLFKALFVEPNPTPLKAALALSGFPVGIPRLPLLEATPKTKDLLKNVLRDLSVLAAA